jgi:hypothetical protein
VYRYELAFVKTKEIHSNEKYSHEIDQKGNEFIVRNEIVEDLLKIWKC